MQPQNATQQQAQMQPQTATQKQAQARAQPLPRRRPPPPRKLTKRQARAEAQKESVGSLQQASQNKDVRLVTELQRQALLQSALGASAPVVTPTSPTLHPFGIRQGMFLLVGMAVLAAILLAVSSFFGAGPSAAGQIELYQAGAGVELDQKDGVMRLSSIATGTLLTNLSTTGQANLPTAWGPLGHGSLVLGGSENGQPALAELPLGPSNHVLHVPLGQHTPAWEPPYGSVSHRFPIGVKPPPMIILGDLIPTPLRPDTSSFTWRTSNVDRVSLLQNWQATFTTVIPPAAGNTSSLVSFLISSFVNPGYIACEVIPTGISAVVTTQGLDSTTGALLESFSPIFALNSVTPGDLRLSISPQVSTPLVAITWRWTVTIDITFRVQVFEP